MLITHDGVSPRLDSTAWIAPNAVICGNVTVGPGCRVMFGAQVIAEGGSITIGRECSSLSFRSPRQAQRSAQQRRRPPQDPPRCGSNGAHRLGRRRRFGSSAAAGRA
jgi:hypothetical protein